MAGILNMNWQETEKKALALDIPHPDRYAKSDLIRTIQKKEGNFDCYGQALAGECGQVNCFWRRDCLLHLSLPGLTGQSSLI